MIQILCTLLKRNKRLWFQVLCMGTQSVFMDNANEQHNIILLKHFTEKNRAAVVDVKTRKRRTGKRGIQSEL